MVKGWFNESKRHALARQGIRTGRKQVIPLTKDANSSRDRSFIQSAKDHLIHGFQLAEDEAEHLVHEIRTNAPKTWNWLKEKSHNLREAIAEGVQKYKEEHPEHTETSAEAIEKIESQPTELVPKPEQEEMELDYEYPQPTELVEPKPSVFQKIKQKRQEIIEKKQQLTEELMKMSDRELREKAVRFRRGNIGFVDFLLGSETNPYEKELLRRVKEREVINKEVAQIRAEAKQGKLKKNKEPSFMDIMFGRDLK